MSETRKRKPSNSTIFHWSATDEFDARLTKPSRGKHKPRPAGFLHLSVCWLIPLKQTNRGCINTTSRRGWQDRKCRSFAIWLRSFEWLDNVYTERHFVKYYRQEKRQLGNHVFKTHEALVNSRVCKRAKWTTLSRAFHRVELHTVNSYNNNTNLKNWTQEWDISCNFSHTILSTKSWLFLFVRRQEGVGIVPLMHVSAVCESMSWER